MPWNFLSETRSFWYVFFFCVQHGKLLFPKYVCYVLQQDSQLNQKERIRRPKNFVASLIVLKRRKSN